MQLDALAARCTFPAAGTSVRCGVSGGPDSLALLVLACEAGCEVTAIHVDHGLRPESADEATLVQEVAASHGAAFQSVTVDVARGPNLEARARRARHDALGADALLGHTMDDQAETMLLALLRGAGVEGLAGMRPDRRPLLAIRRHETHALCAALGLSAVADPTNEDPGFRRNRIRHDVLPLLSEVAERDVVPVMARQATLLRQVAEHLAAEASSVDPTDARAAGEVPEAVLRVALRTWLRGTSAEAHPPDAAALDRVLRVVRGDQVGTELAGGTRVRRSGGRLRLEAGGERRSPAQS
jgi:tRNA(Ile)-lysidine synthase